MLRVGFVVERHGKHTGLVRERDRRTVPVPVHGAKRIGPGLLRKLLRQSGVTAGFGFADVWTIA